MHMASRPGGSSAPPSADLLPTFTYTGAGPLVFPPRGIRLKFALPGAGNGAGASQLVLAYGGASLLTNFPPSFGPLQMCERAFNDDTMFLVVFLSQYVIQCLAFFVCYVCPQAFGNYHCFGRFLSSTSL
jgi:hypothetical protein